MSEEQKEERMLAMRAARFCRGSGMSMTQFKELIDLCAINPPECNDALWALKNRGELEHLIQWVWTFRKR